MDKDNRMITKKFMVNLSDETFAKDAIITVEEDKVPIFYHFDHTKPLGRAALTIKDGEIEVLAEVDPENPLVKELLRHASSMDALNANVSGMIVSREGNTITELKLLSVGLVLKNLYSTAKLWVKKKD